MTKNIGQQLLRAREARSLTLEQVATSTHMRLHYLQALENGDFNALPSVAQARGFLRTYASFLGLNPDLLLADLNVHVKEDVLAEPIPDVELFETRPVAHPVDGKGATENGAQEKAGAIFVEMGLQLQRQRELLGLSLEDVERHTHLRTHYLRALEAGKLEDLPSPVQGRGMLKNYTTFLGLDPEPLLLRFAEGLQARLAAQQAAQPRKRSPAATESPRPVSPLRRLFNGELLVGGVLVISLAVFVVWGALRIFEMRSEEQVSPTGPSVAQILLATATVTPTLPPATPTQPALAAVPSTAAPSPEVTTEITGEPTGEEGDSSPDAAPSGGTVGSVQVYVTIRQRAWMRVLVDGEIEFEGRVIPGSAYQFSGDEQVEILTGNGAALQIFFGQQDLGPLGLFGQIVHRVFTVDGIQTPTPTVTVTGTAAPPASPTPRGTGSPQPGLSTAIP
jgi:cytoskeletal protein RodZ